MTTYIETPLGTVLSIWAHPDDETYLAGGIMATARDRGERVVCAVATAGERGTADPDTWPPDRLGPIRRREAAAAMSVLGIIEHHVHHLPDGVLADHERAGQTWAAAMLESVRPDTILTFGPDGITFHPDHVAVHRWVTHAWRSRGRPGRLLYAALTTEHLERFGPLYEQGNVFMTDERPTGIPSDRADLVARLDGDAVDRKFTALRAMPTQTADLMAALDHDLYRSLIAVESFVDARPTRSAHVSLSQAFWRNRDAKLRRQSSTGSTRSRWCQRHSGQASTT